MNPVIMGKRKYSEEYSRSDAKGMSIGDTLREVKKVRSSSEEAAAEASETVDGHGQGKGGDDGWQVVTAKRQKSKASNRVNPRALGSDAGPRVYFDSRREHPKPVRLEELRDLALYVLTDSIAPSWIAVKHRQQIRKVVTIMIPGMDDRMISRAATLKSPPGRQQTPANTASSSENVRLLPEPRVLSSPEQEAHSMVTSVQPTHDGRDEISWLHDERFAVRVPGDPHQLKVHSPLQALVMKNYDEPSDARKAKSTKERAFHAVRTPISEFIHTSDELREAEYPIHPVLFTSEADKALEGTRRQHAKQVAQYGWVDSDAQSNWPIPHPVTDVARQDFVTQGMTVYAIDCEMVLTSDEKSSLARISVVSWPDGRIVLDKYVKPDLPITNYFTQYSGITEKILENVTVKLTDVQEELKTLLTSSTVLLGHSLESDLNALKMTHPFIVDTSMIYPHPRGLPLRSSLKFLANKYLRREIQKGGANGHDSVEDARAVLDLVKLKCEKGPKWGTNEANGETVFKKLSRSLRGDGRARSSAIVEYGTPERGFGKDATCHVGCQNDDEIVAGILKSIKGNDKDQNQSSEGGVDYVWARLRALEFARGWVTPSGAGVPVNNNININSNSNGKEAENGNENVSLGNDNSSAASSVQPDPTVPQPFTTETDTALVKTVININTIRESLPPNTLLILCSGTSDMRPVMHYQAIQAQYRREFKVKKWDELTVRWTDREEQELRRAVENARLGWGWVGVV